jgi:curli biogenesis system outer membrane secretion channel CsgG
MDMPMSRYRVGLTFLPAAVLLSACATTVDRSLPSSWDDSYLDRRGPDQSLKPVIAVLAFDSKGAPRDIDLKVSDVLTTALARSGRFQLLERERLQKVLEEQKLKLEGLVDDSSKAAEIGQLAGAEALVFASISSVTQQKSDKFAYDLIATEVRIDVRAVNTTTGKLMLAEFADGRAESKVITDKRGAVVAGLKPEALKGEYNKAAAKAATAAAEALAGRFPVWGYVIATSGNEVTTDVGVEKGAARGDTLVVFRALEPMLHPVTKKPFGWKKKMLGLLKVTEANKNSSIAGPDGVDEVPKPGDVVVLRPPAASATAR